MTMKDGTTFESLEIDEREEEPWLFSSDSAHQLSCPPHRPQNIRSHHYILLAFLLTIFLVSSWRRQVDRTYHPSSAAGTLVTCTKTNGGRLCDDDLNNLLPHQSTHSTSTIKDVQLTDQPTETPLGSFDDQDTPLEVVLPTSTATSSPTRAPTTTPAPTLRESAYNDMAKTNQSFSEDSTMTEESESQSTKYLLYFAESGWANQEIGLEHAYYIARALKRTLILPPILPHLGKGSTIPKDVFGMDSGNFKTGVDPLKYYVKKLPENKYTPMSAVLDLDFSLRGVSTIDAKVFASQADANALSRWVIETNYSHFNTQWCHHCADREGSVTTRSHTEYGVSRLLNMTVRDIAGTLGEFRHSADVLVLLDGFNSVFDASAMDPPIQPRMNQLIRRTAAAVRDRWPVSAYASVHIRGGDGRFSQVETLYHTITTVMRNISTQIVEWLGDHSWDDLKVDTVGLFVATDVNDLFNHTVTVQEISLLVDSVFKSSRGVTVDLMSSKNISEEAQALDGLRYSSVFMDIQMAACATIGFVGTEGSTFSKLIEHHRHESSCQ